MRPTPIVASFLLVSGFWWLDSREGARNQLSYELKVRVVNAAGPIRRIEYKAFFHRESAEWCVRKDCPSDTRRMLGFKRIEPYREQLLEVDVIGGSTQSLLTGRELHRVQERYLAFIAELDDGEWIDKAVEIPDCRESSEISVTIP